MKKPSLFQTLLLSSFGALAVAGVLIFALATTQNNNAGLGSVTIWGTFNGSAISAYLRTVTETNPSLAQVTYVQKDPATYQADLTQALASGTGPDLFILRQDDAVKDTPEILAIPYSSLSRTQFQNAFVDAASPYLGSTGVLAVPALMDPMVLYYNRDILSSSGFAQPPQYWDQLFAMATKITQKDAAGEIKTSLIPFGEYQNIANAKDILSLLIMQAGGAITLYDSQQRLTSALAPKGGGAAAQATPSALLFYTEFADPSKDYYTWNRSLPEAQQAFAAGNVALYVGYASEAALIAQTNPNLNFGIAPVPQIRGSARTVDVGHVYGFATTRASRNPSGAITVAYLLASSVNSASLSTALGIPSARLDVLAQPVQGDQDLFNKEAITSHSWTDPNPAATASIFQAMIEDTTSGALLMNDAISRADQQLAHLLTTL